MILRILLRIQTILQNDNSNNSTLSELSASACEIPQTDMVPGLQRDMRFEGLEDSF